MGNKNELNRYVMEKELNIDIANKQNVVQKLSHCLNVFELESQQGSQSMFISSIFYSNTAAVPMVSLPSPGKAKITGIRWKIS